MQTSPPLSTENSVYQLLLNPYFAGNSTYKTIISVTEGKGAPTLSAGLFQCTKMEYPSTKIVQPTVAKN